MPLKLLPHKSWHVYNQENVARVKRDEAQAALEQEQHDDRAFRADAEARLDRLRNKHSSRKRRRTDDGDDDAEQALQRQLAGKGTRRDEDEDQGGSHANAIIVRPEGWTASGKKDSDATATAAASMTTNGHLNFWAELEAGAQGPTTTTLEKRLDKVLAQEPDSLTKVYLAKKGEGEPRGWYASPDGKTDRERKEPVEKTLERTELTVPLFPVVVLDDMNSYRDNESKKLDDPLALMNSYLQRRQDIKEGKPLSLPSPRRRGPSTTRDRYLEPVVRRRDDDGGRDGWDDTPRSSSSEFRQRGGVSDKFEPVLPRLLPPKHRRPPPPPPALPSGAHDPASSSSSSSSFPAAVSTSHAARGVKNPDVVVVVADSEEEASQRVRSERARAAALLASRRRAALASSSATASPMMNSPARSEGGTTGGWGMYNREEVLAAANNRSRNGAGAGGSGGAGRRTDEGGYGHGHG
ncbi:hypothetical protein B0A53_03842 [Rhodotorula sp. CCFEE 5036]|nr:hypothetical protein B0A53_03842 [Rhodotorula sp. CCFEE 5036]